MTLLKYQLQMFAYISQTPFLVCLNFFPWPSLLLCSADCQWNGSLQDREINWWVLIYCPFFSAGMLLVNLALCIHQTEIVSFMCFCTLLVKVCNTISVVLLFWDTKQKFIVSTVNVFNIVRAETIKMYFKP